MWHIFIMERIDQMENKQKPVERETRQLIQTYNVLLKSQIYAYFAKTQRDHFVGRTFKTLEKEKQIYDLRHEVIETQIKYESAQKMIDEYKEKVNALQREIIKLEAENNVK